MIGGAVVVGRSDQDSCGHHNNEEDDGEAFPLPGFRFHPTDEELVGFYLSRKVQKKSIKIEIIKHVDIYKFDPWDLPRWSSTENESYFFCKRGRKYRNSVRPNRVTCSGFWKATGIDKPVYSDNTNNNATERRQSLIIGLKKTLVYYRGSAGKGIKTDWMMHEFRLPTTGEHIGGGVFNHSDSPKCTSSQEAEVWTLCRIFKRNVSSRKYTPDWRELASNKRAKPHHPTNNTSSVNSNSNREEAYINFGDPNNNKSDIIPCCNDQKNAFDQRTHERNLMEVNQLSAMPHHHQQALSTTTTLLGPAPEFSNVLEENDHHVFSYGNWDELRSVVEFALDPSL